jgi:hypothetical protein
VGAQVPGGMTNPVGQRRAVEIDALPRVDLRLAIQRKMVGIFGDENLGHRRLDNRKAYRSPTHSKNGCEQNSA